MYFSLAWKRNNKRFCRTKFKCVWRRPKDASKHTKTFFWQNVLLIIRHAHKNKYSFISGFVTQQFADIGQ